MRRGLAVAFATPHYWRHDGIRHTAELQHRMTIRLGTTMAIGLGLPATIQRLPG